MKPIVTYKRGLKRERSEDKWEQLKKSLSPEDEEEEEDCEQAKKKEKREEKGDVVASPEQYVTLLHLRS
jgi:hypothetical protein